MNMASKFLVPGEFDIHLRQFKLQQPSGHIHVLVVSVIPINAQITFHRSVQQ